MARGSANVRRQLVVQAAAGGAVAIAPSAVAVGAVSMAVQAASLLTPAATGVGVATATVTAGLTIDASTPAIKAAGTTATAITTAASNTFTPPSNSLLAVIVQNCANSNLPTAMSGGGLTYAQKITSKSSGTGSSSAIWMADVGVSPGAMAVTATISSTDSRDVTVSVVVFTNAALTANQTGVTGTAGNSAASATMTTGVALAGTQASSWLIGCCSDFAASVTPTFTAPNTDVFNGITQLQLVAATGDSMWLIGNNAVGNTNATLKVLTPTGAISGATMAAIEVLAAPAAGPVAIVPVATALGSVSAATTAPALMTMSVTAVGLASASVNAPAVITPVATAPALASGAVTAPALLTATATAVGQAVLPLTAPALIPAPVATAVALASAAATAPALVVPVATAVGAASAVVAVGGVPIAPSATVIAQASTAVTAAARMTPVATGVAAAILVATAPSRMSPTATAVGVAAATVTVPGAAPVLVQSASSGSTGGGNPNPNNQAFASAVTAGNLMVVAIGGDDSTQSHPTQDHNSWTITDTLGSTWHLRGTGQLPGGTYYLQIWDAIAPAGGANTIHWNSAGTGGATFARIAIHEISGVDTLDNCNVVTGTAQNAVGSITTAQAAEYILAWLVHNSGLTGVSAPFTALELTSSEYTAGLVTSSAGTYTPTGVNPGAVAQFSVLASGYYKSAGGPVALTPTASAAGAATATVTAPTTGFTPAQTKNSAWVISAGTTGTISFTSNVTAGNSIVALLGWNTFTLTGTDLEPITVTDNLGNTYNLDLHETGGPAFRGVGMAKADNVAAGATTLTITINATGYLAAALFELPPCLSMSANGAATTVPSSGNVSTGSLIMLDGGLVLTPITTEGATSSPVNVTMPSGYTSLSGVSVFPSGNNAGFSAAYGANATDGGVNVIWNMNEVMDRATVAAWCLVPVTELRPRLIQTAAQTSSGSTNVPSYSATLPAMAVQKGNRIIVALGGAEAGGVHGSWTVTDDQGNTYHKDTEVLLSGSYWTQVWSAIAAKSAQTTPSWGTAGGATFARLLVHEVFNASTGIDDAQVPTGFGTTLSGSVGATKNANEYLFGWLVHNSGISSVSSPWVQINVSTSEVTAQRIPGATGTSSISAPALTSDAWCMGLVSYYRAAVPNLSPSATAVGNVSALVTAAALLTPTAQGVASVSATVTAAARLTPIATGVALAQATVTTVAPLAAVATAVGQAQTTVTTTAPLTVTAQGVAQAQATVTTSAPLTAGATAVSLASATVTAIAGAPIVPVATAVSASAATATAAAVLSPAAQAMTAAVASSTAPSLITASGQALGVAVAAITAPAQIAASATGIASAVLPLTAGGVSIVLSAQAVSAAVSTVKTTAPLTATAVAVGQTAAPLTAAVSVNAAAQALGQAVATVKTTAPLSATAQAVSQATALVTAIGVPLLTPAAQSIGAAAAATTAAARLTPVASAVTVASATVIAPIQLTAVAQAIGGAGALLTAPTNLAPTAVAVAQATLTIFVPGLAFLVPAATAVSQATALVIAPQAQMLAPAAQAQATATASITAAARLTPVATAVAQAATQVTYPARLTPTATSLSSATASSTASSLLSPSAIGAASTSTALTAAAQLAPVAVSNSTASLVVKTAMLLAPAAQALTTARALVVVPVRFTANATALSAARLIVTAPASAVLELPLYADVVSNHTRVDVIDPASEIPVVAVVSPRAYADVVDPSAGATVILP